MIQIGLSGDCKACHLKSAHTKLHAISRHNFITEAAKVIKQFRDTEHAIWFARLKLSLPSKNHQRMKCICGQEVEKLFHRLQMKPVLHKRILKSKLGFEEHLCPLSLLGIGKDPTFVILCLNHKDAKPRNQNVINLGGPLPQFQRDVIQQVVLRRSEFRLYCMRNKRLTTVLK